MRHLVSVPLEDRLISVRMLLYHHIVPDSQPCPTLMNVECRYIYLALPVNLSAISQLTVSQICLCLTGRDEICISHWWQLSLILLAAPNYHHVFMQPVSRDCASLQGISAASFCSYSHQQHLPWMNDRLTGQEKVRTRADVTVCPSFCHEDEEWRSLDTPEASWALIVTEDGDD